MKTDSVEETPEIENDVFYTLYGDMKNEKRKSYVFQYGMHAYTKINFWKRVRKKLDRRIFRVDWMCNDKYPFPLSDQGPVSWTHSENFLPLKTSKGTTKKKISW